MNPPPSIQSLENRLNELQARVHALEMTNYHTLRNLQYRMKSLEKAYYKLDENTEVSVPEEIIE